jgi:hypothetical protein
LSAGAFIAASWLTTGYGKLGAPGPRTPGGAFLPIVLFSRFI